VDPLPPDHRIARAAGVVMAGFGLSTALGLLNRVLYTRAFGATGELDAFLTANRLPDLLFNLLAGGALASAFLPTFSNLLARQERADAWRLASATAQWVLLALGSLSALAWLLAPGLIRLLAPGFDPAQVQLAASLLRIQLLAPTLFGLSGLLMSTLQAHQRFLLSALAPSLHWLGWIVASLLFVPAGGIHGLAWGVVLGAGLHLLIQLPALRGLGARFTPTFGLDLPALRQVGRLMAPRLFGVAMVQVHFLVNIILASGMSAGSLVGLTLAFSLMLMPEVVIAQAVATAALPTFSSLAALGKREEMRAALATTLRGLVFLSLPASLGLMLLRRPIVSLLFERGAFDARSAELAAWPLLWYAAGLMGHAVVELVSRAFYALQDTRTPVTVGALAMALNVAFSLIFSAWFSRSGWPPHGGLALANSLATGLESLALLLLMGRRLDGLELGRQGAGLRAAAVAGAGMGVGLWGWLQWAGARPAWLVALGGVALGGLLYWGAALLLRSPDARQLPRLLLPRH
jgi:putative peptidoglycan lipid II flippase